MDIGLKDILKAYMGSQPDLSGFALFSSTELTEVSSYVDRFGNPYPIYWDIYGERSDDIWISPSLRNVMDKIIGFYGVNRPPIHDGDWKTHMAYIYLMGDAGIECIVTVTMQTGFAIHKYGDSDIRHIALHMFGDELPIYYGATWFSEIYAGSDLGSIESVARYIDGRWRIYGVKYFTSNIGFSDYALIVARREDAVKGIRGVSLFLMPTRIDGKPNYKLIRLKDKVGTINVPTGEVELDGSLAIPIGELDKGYYYALENLMISRLANSIGSVGIARRSLMEAYLFSLGRVAFGKRLVEHPLYRLDLLNLDALTLGDLALSLKAIDLWELVQDERPPYSEEYIYARIYNHIAKAVTAKDSIYVTSEAMELLGGRGFLKDYIVEKLHREALVTSIWEGTTNIHSLDFIEALIVKRGYETLLNRLDEYRDLIRVNLNPVDEAVKTIKDSLDMSRDELILRSKYLAFRLGRLLSLIELYKIGDIDSKYLEIAEIYRVKYVEGRETDRAVDSFEELFTISKV